MTFDDFSKQVSFGFINPENYTHFVAVFNDEKTETEFYSYISEKIPNLQNIWALKVGNSYYVAVENSVEIPQDFADFIDTVEFANYEEAE
jgi:hypothetical protein